MYTGDISEVSKYLLSFFKVITELCHLTSDVCLGKTLVELIKEYPYQCPTYTVAYQTRKTVFDHISKHREES